MKNSNEIIGNRTRDLPACGAVPQSNAPPRGGGGSSSSSSSSSSNNSPLEDRV